jgi:hypothetical protein
MAEDIEIIHFSTMVRGQPLRIRLLGVECGLKACKLSIFEQFDRNSAEAEKTTEKY